VVTARSGPVRAARKSRRRCSQIVQARVTALRAAPRKGAVPRRPRAGRPDRNGSCTLAHSKSELRDPRRCRSDKVKNPFSSKDLSEATRRRIELAIAVAQERLLSTHVDHALRLIRLVGEQVPFENALGIYT